MQRGRGLKDRFGVWFLSLEIGLSGLVEIGWIAKPSPIGLGWNKSAFQA